MNKVLLYLNKFHFYNKKITVFMIGFKIYKWDYFDKIAKRLNNIIFG